LHSGIVSIFLSTGQTLDGLGSGQGVESLVHLFLYLILMVDKFVLKCFHILVQDLNIISDGLIKLVLGSYSQFELLLVSGHLGLNLYQLCIDMINLVVLLIGMVLDGSIDLFYLKVICPDFILIN
jgi:hypothetical protein